jgi:hypothetical protein
MADRGGARSSARTASAQRRSATNRAIARGGITRL